MKSGLLILSHAIDNIQTRLQGHPANNNKITTQQIDLEHTVNTKNLFTKREHRPRPTEENMRRKKLLRVLCSRNDSSVAQTFIQIDEQSVCLCSFSFLFPFLFLFFFSQSFFLFVIMFTSLSFFLFGRLHFFAFSQSFSMCLLPSFACMVTSAHLHTQHFRQNFSRR